MIIIILKLSKRKRKILAKMLRFTQIFDTLLLLIFERTGASHVSVPPRNVRSAPKSADTQEARLDPPKRFPAEPFCFYGIRIGLFV